MRLGSPCLRKLRNLSQPSLSSPKRRRLGLGSPSLPWLRRLGSLSQAGLSSPRPRRLGLSLTSPSLPRSRKLLDLSQPPSLTSPKRRRPGLGSLSLA
ncbi:hypothetical protein ACOBQX_18685 [Actinokineospora sp. G85]|uniref:hypothetical protein n=1 Tax=Actinokineospora sp. G85 TaxID=3406626 RepID=UPI003C73A8E0